MTFQAQTIHESRATSPDHSAATWTVYFASSADASYLKQIGVDTAIY